jgi:uncharacterized hydrophobic protein (TIGR00271 family)
VSRDGWRDLLARHMGLGEEEKFQVYRSIANSANLRDATYWAEIIFSAGIATLGLTLGSPAVIIGAMLIAPLMGPLLSAGLSLAAGDFVLAVRAGSVIAISTVLSIAFSTLLVVLLPFREMTAEIAARTQPTTLDLFVALFSGAIGALAVSKSLKGVATSIPGVAIAVALMPPLCVTGYGIGLLLTVDRVQGLNVLRGGALLFFTNLVAIAFASMLVFLALHIDAEPVRHRIREARDTHAYPALPSDVQRIGSLPARLLLAFAMLGIIFIPLKRSFDALTREIRAKQEQNIIQREAVSAWEELFGRTPGGRSRSFVDRFDATERDGRLHLTLRVFTMRSASEEERDFYVRRVAGAIGREPERIELSLIEIPTSQFQLDAAKPDPTSPVAPPTLGERLWSIAGETRRMVANTELPPGFTRLAVEVTVGTRAPTVIIEYLAPAALSDDARALITSNVRQRLDLATANARFDWVPSRLDVAMLRSGALPQTAREHLATIAGAMERHPSLQVTIEASTAEDEPGTHVEVVSSALEQMEVSPQRIQRRLSGEIAPRTVRIHVALVEPPSL